MSSSEGLEGFGSPRSQFSLEEVSASHTFSEGFSDEEIVWARSDSDGAVSEGDFILLGHPLLDARSLPSTFAESTGHPESEADLSSAFDNLSFDEHGRDSENTSHSDGSDEVDLAALRKAKRTTKHTRQKAARKAQRAQQQHLDSSDVTSDSSEFTSGTSTPTGSYEEAAAFITRHVASSITYLRFANRHNDSDIWRHR